MLCKLNVRVCAYAVAASFAVQIIAAGGAAEERQEQDLREARARQLAEAGVQFDLEGESQYARAAYQSALREDPDCELARWRLGQVRYGDDWITADKSALSHEESARLTQYQRRREHALDAGPRETELAIWCRANGAEDVARVHFRRVAENSQADPATRSLAMRRLGLREFAGQLMTGQQVAEIQAAWRQARADLHEWLPKLERLSGQILSRSPAARRSAQQALREIDDPVAIGALELSFSSKDEALASLAVQTVSGFDARAASESLVRHAIAAAWPAVREEATVQLRRRPLHDVVPPLLGALETPVKSVFRITAGAAGQLFHQHVLLREGVDEDVALKINSQFTEVPSIGPGRRRSPAEMLGVAQGVAARIERTVASKNDMVARQNELVYTALRATTGASASDTPRDWWDWWREYNDYESPGYRPVREYQQQISYQLPTIVPVHECFPIGTLVWTQSGKSPIEAIRVGDRVLSQDAATGQLQYKPVVRVTQRSDAQMQTIQAGEKSLTLTQGHPVWVDRRGWRMARLLRLGERVHSIEGPLRVQRLELAAPGDAYNLVVADFGTYFVTDAGILVHDNTYRTPSTAVTPGLLALSPRFGGTP